MGNRNRRKRKKRRQKSWKTLIVRLPALDLAKGHDGFMRGKPEPVLITVGYGLHAGGIELLGRALRRPEIRGAYPVSVATEAPELFRSSVQLSCTRLALLTVALEEDDGKGVEQIYGALAEPQDLQLWRSDADVPAPVSLEQVEDLSLSASSDLQVNLIWGQSDLRDLCQQDSWIGASLVVLPLARSRWSRLLRFVDEEERNDWSARLEIDV